MSSSSTPLATATASKPARRLPGRALTVAYLALVREARPGGAAEAVWQNWYRFFPWEDWRSGKPAALAPVEERLGLWARQAHGEARAAAARGEGRPRFRRRLERGAGPRALRAALRGGADPGTLARSRPPGAARRTARSSGVPMAADHRRILATAIGRLRGKIKYRPVVFELMPPAFTLAAAAAHGRGAVGRAAAQAEFSPARRAARPGRGDRRDQRRDRRPPGAPRAVPPRGPARAPGARSSPACRPPFDDILTTASTRAYSHMQHNGMPGGVPPGFSGPQKCSI